jgi:hypothetical protein
MSTPKARAAAIEVGYVLGPKGKIALPGLVADAPAASLVAQNTKSAKHETSRGRRT